MKRLRNTGIYFTIVGVLLAISFIFFKLWPISLIGILLLLIFFVLKYGFKVKRIPTKFSKRQLQNWDTILMLIPVLYVAIISWYISRPYLQTVVLPQGYEGVVAIQYNQPNGQEKKWVGGFLGIGASRLIRVDSTGIAKTRFTFHHNAIPILGLNQTTQNWGGLEIYYENDLDHEIIPDADGRSITYENKEKGKPNIYFTGFKTYPLIIFVITKPENYYDYFMTKKEVISWYKQKNGRVPSPSIYKLNHLLNKKYDHLYDLQDYYLKN